MYIDAEKKEEFCRVVLQLESSGLSMGHFGADITDGNFVQMQERIQESVMRESLVKTLK